MSKTLTVRGRRSKARDTDEAAATATLTALDSPPDDAIRAMIAEAAYYRAEHRGFAPGHELDDWLASEIELSARLQTQLLQSQFTGNEVH